MFRVQFSLLLTLRITVVGTIPIDNGVIGVPIIECTTQSISVKVNTEKPFFGRVFVKGMSKHSQCMQDFSRSAQGVTTVQLTLPLGTCDMQRERKLNPTGLQEATTIIVSFHALFITKVDKAYALKCFFMSAAEKVFTQEYQVSMITTQEVQQAFAAMPTCDYSVRRGTLSGALVRFAIVGEKLFHVWKCVGSNFGILVRNCVVQDSTRTQFVAIDSQGCSTDHNVVNDLTYGVNLDEAFVEVHAFKFADDVNVFFKCELTFCQKTALGGSSANEIGETTCRGVTPPVCNGRSVAVSQSPLEISTEFVPFRPPYKHHRAQRNVTVDEATTVTEPEVVATTRFIETVKEHEVKTQETLREPAVIVTGSGTRRPSTLRVMDVVPKNNFVVLDPTDTSSSRMDDRDESDQMTYRDDTPDTSRTSKKKTGSSWNEQWTFIVVGFAILATLLVLAFIMVFALIYMMCKKSNNVDERPFYNQFEMSPNCTMRRY